MMNTTSLIIGVVALVVGGFVGVSVAERHNDDAGEHEVRKVTDMSVPDPIDFVSMRPELTSLPHEDLSVEERDGLLLMREEEKLARDVYMTLYDEWGLQIFANIAQSEQTHTEAVRDLLVKYDIADPVVDDTIGAFTNTDMQKLYDDLVAQGTASLTAGLVVGATIEDLDIYDLEQHLAATDNEDIALVYENLMRGSRNHLRAFTRQLNMQGETYEPQYITAAEYEAIVSSDRETGNGDGAHGGGRGSNGGGNGGRGWGRF